MVVFTHMEPLDDPASWSDQSLDHNHDNDLLESKLTPFDK
jgi:hypothetical protein